MDEIPNVTFSCVEASTSLEDLFAEIVAVIDSEFNEETGAASPEKKRSKAFPTRVDQPAEHEVSYDPMVRWNVLGKYLRQPRGFKGTEHEEVLRQSNPCYGSLLPRRDRPAAHEQTYDPVARWAAMAPHLSQPRGFKDTKHTEVLRQSNPCYGSLLPRRDRPSAYELSWDPLVRWIHMSPLLHEPRGAKSVEHLEVLRQSNPSYGSLLPKTDRPAAHEVSYDPLVRWNVLGKYLGERRGAKSVEHLEVLRQSNPSYGSLLPKTDRPAAHEVSYDPLVRWNVLGKYLGDGPRRGAKSVEHLEVLRQSNPEFSSLRPSIFKYLPFLGDVPENSSILVQLRQLRAHSPLLPSGTIKKSFNLDSFDEYTDDESEESGDGVSELLPDGFAAWRAKRAVHREQRDSNNSDSSEMSNARTMERMSNDSVASIVDDESPEAHTVYRHKGLATEVDHGPAKVVSHAVERNLHAGWRVR